VVLFKPNLQTKTQKEGTESDQFWSLLGAKAEYPSQKIAKEHEGDPHLFSCTFLKGFSFVLYIIFKIYHVFSTVCAITTFFLHK
jgi:gelsolin